MATNRKRYYCKICGEKHYAKGLCVNHYSMWRLGYNLNKIKCKICGRTVHKHKDEKLCSICYNKKKRKLRAVYKNDGGKWGYKSWRKLRKYKKSFCESCGRTDRELVISYKDGNTRNDNINNIKTVCRSCVPQRTSKFIRKYGKSATQLAKEFNWTESKIRRLYPV